MVHPWVLTSLGSLTFRFPFLLSFFLFSLLSYVLSFLPLPFHEKLFLVTSHVPPCFSLLSTALVYLLYRVSLFLS